LKNQFDLTYKSRAEKQRLQLEELEAIYQQELQKLHRNQKSKELELTHSGNRDIKDVKSMTQKEIQNEKNIYRV